MHVVHSLSMNQHHKQLSSKQCAIIQQPLPQHGCYTRYMTKSVPRLFQQFQPEHYDLTWDINPDALTFSGTVTVRGKKVGRPSERFSFHQNGLTVTKASITKHDKTGDQTIEVARINNQNSFDEVRLHASGSLKPGNYTVTMEFRGCITRPMNGIYPCFFKHDGQDKKLIATQFESHHAREAFPCIDEPEAKATFALTLITPNSGTALGNTPVKEQKTVEDQLVTSFETTPKMSVYLLAFVYGEIGYQESQTKNGTLVRSYATPDNVASTAYSVDVAVRCLEFFEDFFGVAYPLPKLDMIALPDFSSGAMENWGLVTYRESIMLVDDKSSGIESKQQCALVICHELSHQWFGNLVTMKWWDDLWLNESFANMMEYLSTDALFPEWNIWEQFISHESASAKRRDSLVDVQSVHTDVHHPDEISTIFDPAIVYAKGGTILYMLMNYLGQDAFQTGLQAYFKKHAYGNTTADDLWESLSAASQQDVGAFMRKWVAEPGYPIVDINWRPGTASLTLSQKRFLSDPATEVTDLTPWQVPLATTSQLSQSLLSTSVATLDVPKPEQTLLFNHGGTSYYLPHYEQPAHLQHIVNAIKRHEIDGADRFLLLDNYLLLQRGGISATTELLDLLTAYEDESNETVWGAIAAGIADARRLTDTHDASEEQLDKLIEGLVLELAESLGWDDKPDDSPQTLRLRGLAISLAAGAKTPSIIQEGLERFAKFTHPSDLSASTRGIVYFCGARYGTDADFNKLLALHEAIQNADEKEEIAGGLTSVKKPEHIKQLLALMLTESVKRQDLMHWYVWLLRNRYSRVETWDWLVTNWDWLVEAMQSDKSFGYFPRYCGSVFSTQAELDKFTAFFEPKKDIVALSREITLATQDIQSRVAWRERNEAAVVAWLAKR